MNTKDWPVLYKQDTTGKVRQWAIRAAEDRGVPYYEVEHGVVDGAMVSSRTNIRAGKNQGQSNQTTAWEQCCAEAESLWNKHRNRKGYDLTMPVSGVNTVKFSPMLAKSYNEPGPDLKTLKDGHHIKFPCMWQPKLDGIRCNAHKESFGVGLFSRQNKQFFSMGHIAETLYKLPGFDSNIILDGELYVHGEEFQTLTSAIKRDESSEDSKKIQYHIYDMWDSKNPDMTFVERNAWIASNILPHYKKVKPVYTGSLKDEDELLRVLHKQLKRGYEGIMVRNEDGVYKVGGRSADLQKVKLFVDEEFPIVDVDECRGKMEGMCAFVCETKDGARFKCMPQGSEHERRQMYVDWKLGKIKSGDLLTVRFFAWTTSQHPVPRFPVGFLRDYE